MKITEFDKWFNSQSTLVKAILLLIPVVNWVVEILVRLSVMLRTKETIHVVALLLFVFVGWGWVLGALDFVYWMLKGHLFLAE